MASVLFTQVWLSPASDLSLGMGFPLRSLEYVPAVTLETRQYAGGNFRAFREPGTQRVAKVSLGFLTAVQVAALKVWHGELVCFRDPQGEKFYGTFSDPDFNPRPGPIGTPTTLTFQEASFSEAV